MLEEHGIAYLSVTAGTYNSFFLNPVRQITSRPAHLWKDAALLRRSLKVPIVISGRIITPSLAEELVRTEAVSLIGLGRALLADPGWVQKAAHGKAVALVAPGNPRRRFLVALDLSDASLLVLKFVQYFFTGRPENILTFVHVLQDAPEPANQWWHRARRIMQWDDRCRLTLLPARNGVAADLTEAARSGNYDSLILGQRGLSGIKRWLLGSVSGTLWQNLNDVNLFLIG